MPPKTTELDAKAFREALMAFAEAVGQGVVVCDSLGKVVFSTSRAKRLLGTQNIDTNILELANTNEDSTRIAVEGSPHTVVARVKRLPGITPHFLVMLLEEAPRNGLTKSLVSRFGLSARSVQLVQLTSRGLTNREIAERLRLSEATVKTYMHGLFREVGVRNRAELVALAERMQAGTN